MMQLPSAYPIDVTGLIGPYPKWQHLYLEPEIPLNERNQPGQYFLFAGVDYEGETNVGVYETIAECFKAFDAEKRADYGNIYTIINNRLEPFLEYREVWQHSDMTVIKQWRKAK